MSKEDYLSQHRWTRPTLQRVTDAVNMEDRHHILHTRMQWTSSKGAESLRETPELIPTIDRRLHEYIHRNSAIIPLLGHYALDYVNSKFQPVEGDTLASIDSLMETIESAGMHWKAHPIEQKLGELAVEALEIQRHLLEGEI